MIASENYRNAGLVLGPALLVLGMTGCWAFPSLPFLPGTIYAGEVDCTAAAVGPNGVDETIEFSHALELGVDPTGDFTLDDVDLTAGEEVTRSIGTADLTFEITQVIRIGPLITVRLAPRPTLPGIAVTGELLETYRWTVGTSPAGVVQTTAAADLEIEDAEGTTLLTVECAGDLEPGQ